ncbi:MAG: radical SAM protein, partial [Bacteroidales bacterium]|nr:radical SAM protein [Bacteroidales bacterium]
ISRKPQEIYDNISRVVEFGYKEIVLTGVNIGRYDAEGLNFEDLVAGILALPGDFRLRIGSIEPDGFGDKLFDLFDHPKLTPHMHLCLQSGSDKILLAMRRMYSVAGFRQIVEKVRTRYPLFNFTTDIIVGFPGETQQDFDETLRLVKALNFGHVHTFKYSIRKNTRAERMSDHVSEKEKTHRSELLRQVADAEKRRFRESLIGKKQRVLIEKIDSGMAQGYGELYVPVKFPTHQAQPNTFVDVQLISLEDGDDPIIIGL